MKRTMTKILSLTLASALLALGVGCSGGSENTAATQTGSDSTEQTASSELPEVVNIGTMNLVNGDLIAQYEKLYEEELGVKVNLQLFDSGRDVNTAIAAGSIDISQAGTSPTALGLSSDVPYEVIWLADIIGSAESLVVKNESGIRDIQGLKGKKVATPFASTAHYSLLNALKLAGVEESEVTILDLQPQDIFAAWQRGDIDAAYVWYPILDKLLEDGTVITHSGELAKKGIVTGDATVVRKEFGEKYPDIVSKYLQIQIKANDIILNDKDKAAEEVASVLEISAEDAANQLSQFEYLTADEELDYLNNKLAEILKNTADFLVEQQSITSAPSLDDFKASINTSYLEAAAK